MTSWKRPLLALLAVLGLAFGATACGDDSGDGPGMSGDTGGAGGAEDDGTGTGGGSNGAGAGSSDSDY